VKSHSEFSSGLTSGKMHKLQMAKKGKKHKLK